MVARVRLWGKQIKTHPLTTALIVLFIVFVVLVIFGGYKLNWDWTGFNGSSKSGKTLWDWMQLLFIPVVLAVAGFWFNHRERKAAELRTENEQKAAELQAEAEREIEQQRAKTEHDIAVDNQQEAALQAYINEMSELLLHENLRNSKEEVEVRSIARVRTLTVLKRLDGLRKDSVLQFLYESGLIFKDKPIVDLKGADFDDAILLKANLRHVNLQNVSLIDADLTEGDFTEANLSHAFLLNAKLHRTILTNADLRFSDLTVAELTNTDLQNALLTDSILTRANLRMNKLNGADLSRADLSMSTIFISDLSGANLSDADLTDANLSGAFLGEANLIGTNLRNAEVTIEQLDKANSLKGATMPDGTIHP